MAVPDAFPGDLPVDVEIGRTEAGRAWLASVPGIVADLEDRWDVKTGSPYRGGSAAWVAPATRADGSRAVLKVTWPHREARHEHTGLAHWNGDGAVRLLEADPERYALLVERCEPGTELSAGGLDVDAALSVGGQLLRHLWSREPAAACDLEEVGVVTGQWAGLVRERMERFRPPFDAGLVEAGAGLLESLPATASRRVVVHGDFNPGNILAAEREPWLAIDAKPMVGDPGYDPMPLVLQVGVQHEGVLPDAEIDRRYRLISDLVAEPVERLLAWTLARSVESALWEVSGGRPARAARDMARAAAAARVLQQWSGQGRKGCDEVRW